MTGGADGAEDRPAGLAELLGKLKSRSDPGTRD